MRDTLVRQFGKRTMQRDRIGRCQRAVDGALRRNQTDGPDTRGGIAKPLPDLPREHRDRGLAAGAGDGGDGGWLSRIKLRGRQRQRATRIRHRDKRNARIVFGNPVADNGDRARGNSLIDEARAVGLDARQREEHIARLHHTAVHGDTRDRNIGMLRVHNGIPAEKLA